MPLHSDHWLDLFLFQHLPSPLAHPHPHTNTYMAFHLFRCHLPPSGVFDINFSSLYQQGRGKKTSLFHLRQKHGGVEGGLCLFAYLPILKIRERFLIRLHGSLLIAQALSSFLGLFWLRHIPMSLSVSLYFNLLDAPKGHR